MLVLLLSALAVSAKTTWYQAYDLTNEQIDHLSRNDCYRGAYGGVNADDEGRSLHLFTCPLFSNVNPIAELEDDAFLCVVELAHKDHLSKAEDVILAHRKTDIVFTGRQELIIVSNDEKVRHEKPDLCCPTHFGGLADNALYVPRHAVTPQGEPPVEHPAYIKSVLNKSMEADPFIEELLRAYSRERVVDYITTLSTGRDRTNTRVTRNSYAINVGRAGCADASWNCANHAAQYVVSTLNTLFRDYPGQWRVTTNTFRADMCDNVILEIVGVTNPTKYVLTGAHLDSRNTGSGPTATGIAPGADDNGTGSGVHLELARIIATHRVRFANTVRLMWFCGEEQGLLGSAALATAYRQQNLDVIGMFNMDMIGYTHPPSGVMLSFMTGSATRWLSDSCKQISRTYIPSMAVGDTQACCSDQQSFFSRGFAAAGIFETPTRSVVYPAYHQTTDQWNNGLINYEQVWNFGKAVSACALEYAEPRRSEENLPEPEVSIMDEASTAF